MATGRNRVLAIQILPHGVLWAEMELRGSEPVLFGTGKEPLPSHQEGEPEDEQQSGLRLATSAIWSQTAHSWFERPDTLILFPDSRVTSRYLEVPSDDPERLRDVISFEVSEAVQLPVEEITWDYLRFSESGTGARVLWLATRKSSVDETLSALSPNFPPAAVITPALTGSAALAAPAIREKADQAVITIDVQSPTATFLVQGAEGVFYARSVSIGAGEDSEFPANGSVDLASNLSREVARTYVYARQRFESLSIKQVLIAGEESTSLANNLKPPSGLEVEVVDHVRSLQALGLSEQDASRVPREAASLVAGALQRLTGRERVPNFAPHMAAGPFSKGIQMLGGAVGGRFVLVAALLLVLCVGTSVGSSVWHRNAVQARQAETTDLLKKVKRLQQEERILREIQKERARFSLMFMELAEKIPENITLANVSLDLRTKFTMKGKAQSNQNVDRLVKILQEMRYFRDVTVQKTAFEKEGFTFYLEGKIRHGT